MFSGLQFSFLQFIYININVSEEIIWCLAQWLTEEILGFYPESESRKELFFWTSIFAHDDLNIWKSIALVALAGPRKVNDNLQTCPTVYQSGSCGTLVESTLPVYFCNILLLHLGHRIGCSLNIWISPSIILQNATGSEIVFSSTQCCVSFSGCFLEISFALSWFKSSAIELLMKDSLQRSSVQPQVTSSLSESKCHSTSTHKINNLNSHHDHCQSLCHCVLPSGCGAIGVCHMHGYMGEKLFLVKAR